MKIHQLRNLFPNVSVARYNLAVWQNPSSNSVFFIGREVSVAATEGEPDTGILKLFEVSQDGSILQEKTIWKPIYDGISLEDPRALELPDEDLVIGLTAVLRSKEGNPVPFPAIVKIDSRNTWRHELPPILIIDTFGPGKNLTPIDNHTFLFRPESEDFYHKLLVFSLHSQVPEKLTEIEFPTDLSWARWRIGTAMPPIWLTPNEALFIIHGISKHLIDGKEKYVYSIGRARLSRHDRETWTAAPPVSADLLRPRRYAGRVRGGG